MASRSPYPRFPYSNNEMKDLSSGRDEVDGIIEMDAELTTMSAPTSNAISPKYPGNKPASKLTCPQKRCSEWLGNTELRQFRLNEASAASVMCQQSCGLSSALKKKQSGPEFAAGESGQSCLGEGSGSVPTVFRFQATSTNSHSAALKTTNTESDNHFVSKCTKGSSRSESTTLKKVQWADNIEEMMIDGVEYEQYRNILLALRIPEGSKHSTVDAVRFMLSDPGSDNGCLETLITLATNMLWIKLNRFPTVKELYSAILDTDSKEKPVVTAFIQECHTQRGKDILNSLLTAPTDDQQHLHQRHSHHQQQQHHHKQQPSQQQQQQQQRITERSHSLDTITDSHPPSSTDFSSSESEISTSSSLPSLKDSDLQVLPVKDIDHPRDSMEQTFSTDIAIKALRYEHESLKKMFTCAKCHVRPTEILFLPCGHVSLCAICSDTCNVCPVCDKSVLGEVKIYRG